MWRWGLQWERPPPSCEAQWGPGCEMGESLGGGGGRGREKEPECFGRHWGGSLGTKGAMGDPQRWGT